MNRTRHAMVSVKLVRPAIEYMGQQGSFQTLDVPPRSRLYGLEPRGMETVWSESLTSYTNRLGWRHGVAPRTLAIQEIRPLLDTEKWGKTSPQHMSAFCSANA